MVLCNIILQFWAERAEKVFPGHDVVFHLKVRNDIHYVPVGTVYNLMAIFHRPEILL